MNELYLEGMLKALVKTDALPALNYDHALRVLQEYWQDKAALVWDYASVAEACRMHGLRRPTRDEAAAILDRVRRDYAPEEGMSWGFVGLRAAGYYRDKLAEVKGSAEKDTAAWRLWDGSAWTLKKWDDD